MSRKVTIHDVETLERRIRELEDVLRHIQQWDCLNQPRTDLLADLSWLRKLVDAWDHIRNGGNFATCETKLADGTPVKLSLERQEQP